MNYIQKCRLRIFLYLLDDDRTSIVNEDTLCRGLHPEVGAEVPQLARQRGVSRGVAYPVAVAQEENLVLIEQVDGQWRELTHELHLAVVAGDCHRLSSGDGGVSEYRTGGDNGLQLKVVVP